MSAARNFGPTVSALHNCGMRPRSLKRQLVYGALVVVLAVAGGVVAFLAGEIGIDAVVDGDPRTAIVAGLVALGATFLPVIALAAYMHWLGVTTRTTAPRPQHIPTRSEDWLFGCGTVGVVAAAYPVTRFAYQGVLDALPDQDFALVVGHGVLGLTYIVFTIFCVSCYVRWLR